ncbi:glycoside hydrolase family 5 protein [Teredinibacter haidensis]|uniref:glycoside hydrolase family 5 protein n=1 Tax=Teredinibacter haidensis TaxID=2731755 RepID=UPI000A8C236D|nr:cellulase family glycosylhydrolase [Teredinibacter haidensis]
METQVIKHVLLVCVFLWGTASYGAFAEDQSFAFLKTQGVHIIDSGGEPVFLRGISFGNRVWSDERIPRLHHGKEDYQRVRDLGMNLVRFYLNYRTLEADDNPYHYLDDGWGWIDTNIEWARQHGVYLILNMHVPQGGFQSHGTGWDLWRKPELQDRLIAMWKAIAERYKNESVILGYDLVNEPGVPKSKDEWKLLAQRLVDSIRKVDTNHPIIVERVNSINKKWINDKDMNFFRLKGDNIIYTFHTYDPYYYTHQGIPWDSAMKNCDGGSWPDKRKKYTRQFLAYSIDQFLAWGQRNNVPLYLGEWGLYKGNYAESKGGLNYIVDMLSVIEERKLTNTFHTYHEESFGLYLGDGELDPKNYNKSLKDIFENNF